jgi:hypothetical protein
MSPAQQALINAIALHVGQMILHKHDPRTFLQDVRSLKHELAKAEVALTPVIPDLSDTDESEDDDL